MRFVSVLFTLLLLPGPALAEVTLDIATGISLKGDTHLEVEQGGHAPTRVSGVRFETRPASFVNDLRTASLPES